MIRVIPKANVLSFVIRELEYPVIHLEMVLKEFDLMLLSVGGLQRLHLLFLVLVNLVLFN